MINRSIEPPLPSEMKWSFISKLNYMQISSTIQKMFLQLEKPYLAETVFMILKELLMNANRANAKKNYFEKKGINSEDSDSYSNSLKEFKRDILSNWDETKGGSIDEKFHVILEINPEPSKISFKVRNNSAILPIEKERILTRMERAEGYKTVIDAYKDMGDSSESAGLGLVMSILLLRNIGLTKENLRLHSLPSETMFELEIPSQIIPQEVSSIIKDKLLKELKSLPSLSGSLQRLISLCTDPNVDMKVLIDSIEKNPSVSAEILKLANSVGFIMKSRSMSIAQAVKIIGVKAILRLLYAMGSMNTMSKAYSRMEAQWEHSRRTSFFANLLLKENGLGKLGESVLSGALLHNIGKILLLSVDQEIFPVVRELTNNRATENSKVLEEAAIGMSYSRLGALLSEKWNFPEDLKCIIEFHQQPYMAPEKYRKISEIVYIANTLASRKQGNVHYFSLDEELLQQYKILSESDFEEMYEKYENRYQKEGKDA